MKNLLKNRKGFTLAEILLVVAIVVILSGATVIGVASWVNQSKATADQLVAKNADFEASAVKDVNEKKGTLSTDPVETETLATGNNEGNGGDSGNGGNENSGGNGGNENGGVIGGGNGNGDATEAGESSEETNPPETTPVVTQAQSSGSVQANSGASLSGSSGFSLSDYSSQWGSGSFKLSLDKDMQSCSTITITITAEKDGKISFNNKTYNVKAGETVNMSISNGSHQYWTDPNFSNGSKLQVYFDFGGNDGQYYNHGMNVSVSAS